MRGQDCGVLDGVRECIRWALRGEMSRAGIVIAMALIACATPTQPEAGVHYRPGDPVSGWSEDQLGPEVGPPAAPDPGAAMTPTAPAPGAMDPDAMPPPAGAGGTSAMMPIAGTGGMLPMAGMGGTTITPLPGGTPTSLTLDFTTVDQAGKYSPKNIGAVWVADASGRFIRTLEFWAFIRAQYLKKFAAAGAGFAPVDAISGATFPNHAAHHRVWNLLDSVGAPVPDGMYTIYIEVTDREDSPGAWMQIPFMKGSTPQLIMPPDEEFFKAIKVTYQ